LLGDRAEADLKPELEILADDVKCAHGAAVGDLDAEQIFYLRARGIPESEARRLLLHAFLDDAVAQIADAALRDGVRAAVNDGLKGMA
jgi:Fe-S cluster assembly protein SufD